MDSGPELFEYVVERYVPGMSCAQAAATAQRVSEAVARTTGVGSPVRYLGATFLPADEAVFCWFAAPSAEAVRDANLRAGAPFARVLEAIRLAPQPEGRR